MSQTSMETKARAGKRMACLQDQAIARYREREPTWRRLIALPQSASRIAALRALPHRSIFWGALSVQAYLPKDRGGECRQDYRFHYWLHRDRIPGARAMAALADDMRGIVDLPSRIATPRVAHVGGARIVPFPAAPRAALPASAFRDDSEGLVASKSEADCAACPLVAMLRQVLAKQRTDN